jgi:hypothetical protein
MEGIAHLVSASLARHGFTTQVDHRRLQWSPWLRCESSFSVLLVPSKPGLLVLAEESEGSFGAETTPLTLRQISQVEDLSTELARLFLPTAPAPKPCYVRYAVLEDEDQRRSSHRALQEWMASSSESKNETPNNLTVHTFAKDQQSSEDAGNSLPLARTGTNG